MITIIFLGFERPNHVINKGREVLADEETKDEKENFSDE